MFELKKLDGRTERVGFSYLESLRMMMDWQLRAKGYEPASVRAALLDFDDIFAQRCRQSAQEAARPEGKENDHVA